MAKALGFRPDSLIRARPDPKQKWKLPVKYWIHELHFKRFGHVIGEKPLPHPQFTKPEYDEEAARLFGEQLYWEDYRDRNQESRPRKAETRPEPVSRRIPPDEHEQRIIESITNDDVPF